MWTRMWTRWQYVNLSSSTCTTHHLITSSCTMHHLCGHVGQYLSLSSYQASMSLWLLQSWQRKSETTDNNPDTTPTQTPKKLPATRLPSLCDFEYLIRLSSSSDFRSLSSLGIWPSFRFFTFCFFHRAAVMNSVIGACVLGMRDPPAQS